MKYYKLKANNNILLHIEEGQNLIDTNEEYAEITKAEYDARNEIIQLKNSLRNTDYVVIKIAEATTSEAQAALRTEYAEVIAQRVAQRARINELEATL